MKGLSTQELLENQVIYLTYLLAPRPEPVDSENLRPTYVGLQQIRQNDLTDGAWRMIRQVRLVLKKHLGQRRPVGLDVVQEILASLQHAVQMLKNTELMPAGNY